MYELFSPKLESYVAEANVTSGIISELYALYVVEFVIVGVEELKTLIGILGFLFDTARMLFRLSPVGKNIELLLNDAGSRGVLVYGLPIPVSIFTLCNTLFRGRPIEDPFKAARDRL